MKRALARQEPRRHRPEEDRCWAISFTLTKSYTLRDLTLTRHGHTVATHIPQTSVQPRETKVFVTVKRKVSRCVYCWGCLQSLSVITQFPKDQKSLSVVILTKFRKGVNRSDYRV